jgi:hypothetical protein
MLPEPPVPEPGMDLPPAESLAANDVAKARAEREAAVVMQKPAAAPAEAAEVPTETPAEERLPAEAAESEPASPAAAESEASAPREDRGNARRRKRRRGREKSAERIESEQEAEHNKPTEAEAEAGALTGKLILPTGEKPTAEADLPKPEKPKKLAPGEVYVDEKGNVVIGE